MSLLLQKFVLKTLIIILSVTLLVVTAVAQQVVPTKLNYAILKKLDEASSATGKMNNDEKISVLVKGKISQIKTQTENLGGTFNYSAGDIASIRISLSKINALANNNFIQRIELNDSKIQPLNDQMLINNNILPVQTGQTPLMQGYDGSGVVIGIIDNGIDFKHPDFKDLYGKTRVKYLWDQTRSDSAVSASIGIVPQPYNYGQEWNNSQIDSGNAVVNPYCIHGTHVAGIAAGNGFAVNNYKGVAPNADIIVVAIQGNTSKTVFADATDYIYKKAKAMGKPCVINVSYTSGYIGSHDGNDLEAQLIDSLITEQNGQAFVAAAGNAGNIPIHLSYTVTSDTSFTWFKGHDTIEVWADTADFKNVQFAIGMDKISPDYAFRGNIPFSTIFTSLSILRQDTLYNNGNRLGIIETYGELVHGSYCLKFFLHPDSSNYNWRLMTTGQGKINCWSFDMLFDNIPNSTKFSDIKYYKFPDTEQTIANSFQCSPNVITVGNYVNRVSFVDANGNIQKDTTQVKGAIHVSSSKGPTRDGRIKPDITASGTSTLSSLFLTKAPWEVANEPWKVAFGGKHILGGGTSAAAPVVAGIVALYLQKNPAATNKEVRDAILYCPKQDKFTGNNLPDNTWGYGKVNAFSTLAGGNCVNGIDDVESNEDFFISIYPNPFSITASIHINGKWKMENGKCELNIYDLLGREVFHSLILNSKSTIPIERGILQSGIYFYNVSINGKFSKTQKLIIL